MSSFNPFASAPAPIEKDYLQGQIYQVQEDFLDRFLVRQDYDKSSLNPKYDIIKHYGKIEASWTKFVEINNTFYWRMNKECPPLLFE